MKVGIELLRRFLSDEAGLETVEWAVVGGLIVAALVTVVTTLGKNVLTQFNNILSGVPAN